MNQDTSKTIGVDISKAHLDAHERPSGRSKRFPNDAAGFRALARWIGPEVRCVVYESTGPWHRAMEEALSARLPLARVNALRARRFAQALSPGGQDGRGGCPGPGPDGGGAPVAAFGRALAHAAPVGGTDLGAARAGEGSDGVSQPEPPGAPPGGEAAVAAAAGSGGTADPGTGRRAPEVVGCRSSAGAQSRSAEFDSGNGSGHGRGTAFPDAGTGTDRLQGGGQLGRSGAGGSGVGDLEGTTPYPRGAGIGCGGCCIWPLSPPFDTIRTTSGSIASCGSGARRRRVALTAIMRKMVVLANVLLDQDRVWTPRPVGAIG